MDIKNYLKGEAQRELDSARELTEKLGADGASATAEQRATIEQHMAKAAEYKTKMSDIEENEALRKSIDDLGGQLISAPVSRKAPVRAVSAGDAFVKSETYEALMKRNRNVPFQTEPVEWGFKANETVVAATVDDVGYVQADVQGALVTPAQGPLMVADLFAPGSTNSNTVRFPRVTASTNAAAVAPEIGAIEGGGQSIVKFGMLNEPVEKIATVLYISDEMLEDASGLRSYIDSQLGYFVRATEEDQLLNGDGTPPELAGLLDDTATRRRITGYDSSFTQGGDTIADAVYKAKSSIRKTAFLEPDACVVHPDDWETIRLAKDGNDNYFNGLGPFVGGGVEPPIWGMRVVVTAAIASGTILVGAFKQGAQLFRRGGVSIDASNSNASLFETGVVTLRASERLALAVYRPTAFVLVTLA